MTEPQPGRPIALPTDEKDATDLAAVLSGLAEAFERRPRAITVAREAVWYLWEEPRLPRPLIGSKYPASYPWSLSARTVQNRASRRPDGGWALVYEHLRPQRTLLLDLLTGPHPVDASELASRLSMHLAGAVITRDENRALDAAGLGQSMPAGDAGSDVWARYRAAGFDIASFAPLRLDQ